MVEKKKETSWLIGTIYIRYPSSSYSWKKSFGSDEEITITIASGEWTNKSCNILFCLYPHDSFSVVQHKKWSLFQYEVWENELPSFPRIPFFYQQKNKKVLVLN